MMLNMVPWRREQNDGGTQSAVAPVARMRSDWDRLFDRFLDDVWSPVAGAAHPMPLDVVETDEHIRVRVEVPGVKPEDLDIRLAGEVLTLTAQKNDDESDGTRHYSERRFGSQQRALRLACPVDPDHVEARHANGVVTITLQKAEAVRPKRIRIEAGR